MDFLCSNSDNPESQNTEPEFELLLDESINLNPSSQLNESNNNTNPSSKKKKKDFKSTNVYASTLNEAKESMNKLNTYSYKYGCKTSSKKQVSWLYNCRSHENCDHQIKIKQYLDENDFFENKAFEILEDGEHGILEKEYNHGINKIYKETCDNLLEGKGPKGTQITLKRKFINYDEKLEILPTKNQLKNMKQYLIKKQSGTILYLYLL